MFSDYGDDHITEYLKKTLNSDFKIVNVMLRLLYLNKAFMKKLKLSQKTLIQSHFYILFQYDSR